MKEAAKEKEEEQETGAALKQCSNRDVYPNK